MKPTQIIQQATESLSEEIRMNYVYGNMFLADVIDNYICELKKAITEVGLYKLENKKLIRNIETNITLYRDKIRRLMGEYAYRYTPYMLDRFNDEFERHIKTLFYSVKRELDKTVPALSIPLSHLTMIYMISSLEISRTTQYAEEVQKASGVKMDPVYDQCIVAIRNISNQLLCKLSDFSCDNVNHKEISMAFEILSKELRECKIEICQKAS